MTRIYAYPDEGDNELPEEDVWLHEDWSSSQYFSEPRREGDRNHEEYDCTVHWGTYKRIKFERRYRLRYYETDLEDFLREHPDWDVRFHRGHIFLRDWME